MDFPPVAFLIFGKPVLQVELQSDFAPLWRLLSG